MNSNLPVIILKDTILLPESEIRFEFEDEISKSIIYESEVFHNNKILVITNIYAKENNKTQKLPVIGTIATINKKLVLPNGKERITLKGIERARVIQYLMPSKDTIESIISKIKKQKIETQVQEIIIKKLLSKLEKYIDEVPTMSNSLLSLLSGVSDLDKITDIIANNLALNSLEKLKYLKEINSLKRAEMLMKEMHKEEQLFNIEKNIDIKVQEELDDNEKRFYLKEKINLLKEELGEVSTREEELEQLRESVGKLSSSEKIKNKIFHEIERYEKMSNISPEFSIERNYIDLMLSLPWNKKTKEEENLSKIKEKLDKSHFGLSEVKDRIIEYLAIKKQSSKISAPIICLVGPPGVGKTTMAYSIAESINRNFVKISLGGVDDEAVIKGHIRTYIGATCGKIIDGIKRAASSNPVFLMDEIDKLNSNYKGDPASALLEVLDSTQNKLFKDHYLEEEYDLSDVLFITTANDIKTIPTALLDRLEVINIDGYTELEKISIANDYLIPKICAEHEIKNIKISDEELLNLIRFYTKESGVRELERMISKIVRKKVSNKVINNKKINLSVTDVSKYLGKKIYDKEKIISEIGVVNGLAYTSYGGDIVKIEANHYKGNGNIILTGSMGDIMLESAKIALSYIKANYKKFNIDYNIFKDDIHINIPNIAIPKEGSSAGVTLVTCLISALSNLNINNKIAFTGEITLRGNILGIGGLKEKAIGAYINDISTVFIPYSNIKDLDNIPKEIKDKITFIPVKNYSEIYNCLKDSQIKV